MNLSFKSFASSSGGNVNLLSYGDSQLMLDAGKSWPWIKKKIGFDTSKIRGVLLSHQHGDHSAGIAGAAKSGKNIYALQETFDSLDLSGHRFKPIELYKQFKVGPFAVLPFECHHDVPCCGFLIAIEGHKAAYITDTSYVKDKMPTDLELLAIECNYSMSVLQQRVESGSITVAQKNRIIMSHFGLDNVAEFIKENKLSKLREIHLLHLSDGNSNEKIAIETIHKLTRANVFAA